MKTSLIIPTCCVAAIFACLLAASPVAAAVTLGDGSYDATFSASENGADFGGTISHSGALDVESYEDLNFAGQTIGFSAKLNSDLSLRLSLEPLGASSFTYPLVGAFELTSLDFLMDGSPAVISDITYNATRSNIGQYQGAGDFIPPTISFTVDSATISWGYDGSGLAGDQPFVWFDISTRTVPEPSTSFLLLVGATFLGRKVRRSA